MAVAYFLDPACDRLERTGLSRTLATTVVTVVFALCLATALLILVPLLVEQLGQLIERIPSYVDSLRKALQPVRSEEHTSELQSLMRISYAVFCLKKKKNK